MREDGEKHVGPDIASLSLGGAATLNFRVKSKYWQFKERNVAKSYAVLIDVLKRLQAPLGVVRVAKVATSMASFCTMITTSWDTWTAKSSLSDCKSRF